MFTAGDCAYGYYTNIRKSLLRKEGEARIIQDCNCPFLLE